MSVSCFVGSMTSSLSSHPDLSGGLHFLLWAFPLVFLAGHAHFRTSLGFRYPGRKLLSYEPEAVVPHKDTERIAQERREREKEATSQIPPEGEIAAEGQRCHENVSPGSAV